MHDCGTHTVDVHRIAAGKMRQIARDLGGARHIDAPQHSFALLAFRRAPAGRAYSRDLIDGRVWLVPCHGDDLRDDVSRLAHNNRIADRDPLFIDEILVVQHSAADGRAGQRNRLKNSSRSQCARAPHLDFDIAQHRFLFLRRIFEGNGPLWKF